MTIFLYGHGNIKLGKDIAQRISFNSEEVLTGSFPSGESKIELCRETYDEDIILFQSIIPPVNDHLIELLLTIDALKRSRATNITVVSPYMGYTRQDRQLKKGTPIAAKLVANLLSCAGADRIITFDLHSLQIQGFFDIPLEHVSAVNLFAEDIRAQFPNVENITVVSPDIGGISRARQLASSLGCPLAIIDKKEVLEEGKQIATVVGNVKGQDCIIIDDVVDTGQTLSIATQALRKNGAVSVHGYATHALFSSKVLDKIPPSDLKTLVVTDSLPQRVEARHVNRHRTISLANFISKLIESLCTEEI